MGLDNRQVHLISRLRVIYFGQSFQYLGIDMSNNLEHYNRLKKSPGIRNDN